MLSVNTNGIRFKLTLLYSSVLILSIAILFSSFYWVTQRELYSHTDTILRSHGEKVRDIVVNENLENQNMTPTGILDEMKEIPGMVVFVTNQEGIPIFNSQNFGNTNAVDALYGQYASKNETVITDYKIGSLVMRFIVIASSKDGVLTNFVMVGHPIDVIQTSLRSLTASLTLVFLSLIFPTILGGFFLAGSALKPIGEIGNEMEALSVENLKKRLKSPGTGDEVETLTTAFNRLLDRMEKAFDRERQFMADVAHELKTPIATLKSSIEIALSKPRTNAEYKKEMTSLLADTDRLSQTLSNLLAIAWSQTDISQNVLEPVSLTDMGNELLEIGKKLGNEKKLSFHTHIEKDIIIQGKKDKLFRALLNILENSIKYSYKKGKITLTIRRRENVVNVIVKDTGKGIDPSDIPHIFDRYYRGSKTDKSFGSGLGLAIAHAIITAHKGKIQVTSLVGHGTTFHISLPINLTTDFSNT